MRRLTFASALIVLAAPAFAADPMAVPMTEPGFDWTGYYAGLQAGYGWGQSDISVTEDAPFSISTDIDGGFVGGHVAGLWQFDQAVLGAEADLNYSAVDGTAESGLVEELLSPDLGGSFELLRSVFAAGSALQTVAVRQTEEAGYVISGSFDLEVDGVWHHLSESCRLR